MAAVAVDRKAACRIWIGISNINIWPKKPLTSDRRNLRPAAKPSASGQRNFRPVVAEETNLLSVAEETIDQWPKKPSVSGRRNFRPVAEETFDQLLKKPPDSGRRYLRPAAEQTFDQWPNKPSTSGRTNLRPWSKKSPARISDGSIDKQEAGLGRMAASVLRTPVPHNTR